MNYEALPIAIGLNSIRASLVTQAPCPELAFETADRDGARNP